jgi:hypothetical protein
VRATYAGRKGDGSRRRRRRVESSHLVLHYLALHVVRYVGIEKSEESVEEFCGGRGDCEVRIVCALLLVIQRREEERGKEYQEKEHLGKSGRT